MNTFERLRKGIFLSKDTEEKEKEKDNIVSENLKKIDTENENKTTELKTKNIEKTGNKENTENTENMENTENIENEKKDNFIVEQKTEEPKSKKESHEIKNPFNLLPDIKIENSFNSLFKFIPTFSLNQKEGDNKDSNNDYEPEIIVLDNTDENLKIYQQKMIDLREENNFLKNQIKEYVSKVAWLEEHFTIRQENANIQHLQELEHIRKTNEKETKEYNAKIKELEDSIEVLQTELARQTELLVDEKDTLTFTTNANWSLEKRINELEDKMRIKNSESIDLKAQLLKFSEKLDSKTEEYKELEKKYKKLKNESEVYITENEKLKKENSLLSEKFKIYDNISKRSTKAYETKFYNSFYSQNTPKVKTNSELSFNLYPTSADPNNNSNFDNRKNKHDFSDTKSYSFTQSFDNDDSIMSNRNDSLIEDSDLNDLMDEISFNSETLKKKPTKMNIYDFHEPSSELLSENNKNDDLNPMTQNQNILTEINLD